MLRKPFTPANTKRFLRPLRRPRDGRRIIPVNWQTEGASSTTQDGPASEDLLKSPAKKVEPPLLFPWRHDNEIPDRLVQREHNFDSKVMSYESSVWMINSLTAKAYLNAPFLSLLLGDSWTNELAESCSWAFAQGVGGILSNVYKVPNDEILSVNDNDDLSLDFQLSSSDEETQDKDTIDETTTKDETTSIPSPGPEKWTQDEAMEHIMQEKLRNLFSSAHESGKRKIQVHLSCKPTSSQLYSLHALPGIGRSLAASHPDLLKEIEEENTARKGLEVSKFFERIVSETGRLETTILSDILVYCDESFWVKDLETGATIQGHDDGKIRPVLHAVRMERVLTTRIGDGREWSNWLITDIDDLLDGNRFYNPTVVHWFHEG